MKAGDKIWIAYLRFGKWPTCEKATVRTAGSKQVSTAHHGNFSVEHVFIDEKAALIRLHEIITGQIKQINKELQDATEKLADCELRIGALTTGTEL